MDVINIEMENLKVTFDVLDDGSKITVSHNKASGHLELDVRTKLERKTHWVKDSHKTPEPEQSTFSRVVSREIARIALTHADLNDIPICA